MKIYLIRNGKKEDISYLITLGEEIEKTAEKSIEKEIQDATYKGFRLMREYWSGKLLDVRTGRMLASLSMRLKFKQEEKKGIIYSSPSYFDHKGFYYPLTHEAIGRPYTIIKPKRAKYLKIPPNPKKGYYHWTLAKKVKIPKRPAFKLTIEQLKEEFKNIRIKRIKEKIKEVL